MNRISKSKERQRAFSMGNFLTVIAIAGALYVAKGQMSSQSLMGAHRVEVVKELGQPVAKEQIPRPK